MRTLITGFVFFFAVIAAVLLHMAALYVLPYPFFHMHVLFLFLLLLLLVWKSGLVVWVAFFSFFTIELMGAGQFGVLLTSGTLSMLFGVWLYRDIFTNRSIFAAIALTGSVLACFRTLYTLLLWPWVAIADGVFLPWRALAWPFFLELCFTVVAMAACYLFLTILFRRFILFAPKRFYD